MWALPTTTKTAKAHVANHVTQDIIPSSFAAVNVQHGLRGRVRTGDLPLRRRMLCPAELPGDKAPRPWEAPPCGMARPGSREKGLREDGLYVPAQQNILSHIQELSSTRILKSFGTILLTRRTWNRNGWCSRRHNRHRHRTRRCLGRAHACCTCCPLTWTRQLSHTLTCIPLSLLTHPSIKSRTT